MFGEEVIKVGKSGKPTPDIFLLAMQRINESLDPDKAQEPIKPDECLVFEDLQVSRLADELECG